MSDLLKQAPVALITGASRGIGQAILYRLATNYRVIGTATTKQGASNIQKSLDETQAIGMGAVCNVTELDSVEALFQECKEKMGQAPAILVNNAGITKDNLLMRMKDEQWDQVLETNLRSVYRLSKIAVKDMMKARWGRIINISSVVASMGNPGQSNYCAAKAGLEGFTRSLAIEVAARGITVNAVAPGFIETDMTRALNEQQREAILSRIPAKKLGDPNEVAAAVSFLAQKDAAYMTGQVLQVNGGLYM